MSEGNNQIEDAILLYLRYDDGYSISSLADIIFHSRQATDAAVTRLVDKGLVRKEKDETAWRIRLTYTGSHEIEKVLARTFTRLKFCARS